MRYAITLEHRGLRGMVCGRYMMIKSMSGNLLAKDDHWKGAGLGSEEEKTAQLKRDMDDYIRLEWFFRPNSERLTGGARA